MKKLGLICLSVFLLMTACSKEKDQSVQLEEGTDAYVLAEKIAEKLPYFTPEANNVLAKGKNINITTGTIIQQKYPLIANDVEYLQNLPVNQLRDFLHTFLENFVQEVLLLNDIEDMGIVVEQTEIDSIMQLQYAQVGGEESFISNLEKRGFTMDFVMRDIQNKLLINKYFDERFSAEVVPTEEEIIEAYEQDKTASVQHILFLTQGKSDSVKAEIKAKAEEVLAMAKSGDNFDNLAKKYSEDPGSKDNGGLYENFERGRMVKPFEDASFNLPIGSISDLVETRYGFHIIKVIDRQKETLPLEEVRDMIIKKLDSKKRQDIFEKKVEDLKLIADIEYAPF